MPRRRITSLAPILNPSPAGEGSNLQTVLLHPMLVNYSFPPPAAFAAALAASIALALSSPLIVMDGSGADDWSLGAGGATGTGTTFLSHALSASANTPASTRAFFILCSSSFEYSTERADTMSQARRSLYVCAQARRRQRRISLPAPAPAPLFRRGNIVVQVFEFNKRAVRPAFIAERTAGTPVTSRCPVKFRACA